MHSPAAWRRLNWPLVLLALLLLVGAALRLVQARESLWVDELHTAWCAVGTWDQVAERARIGNQSPLFFWIEWLLARGLGASEFTLRLPSLVAGSLLPAAVFCLAQRWTSSGWVGLVAAAMVVVDPLSILYATEARPYALVELLAVGHMAIVARLVDHPTVWRRTAFVAGAALLFHLHYTAALVVVAELVLLLPWSLGSETRYGVRRLATDLAAVAILCLPAIWHLQDVFARRDNWASFVPQPSLGELLDVLPWSAAAGYVLAVLVWQSFTRRSYEDGRLDGLDSRGAELALAWLLVPLTIAWIATTADVARLLYHRYVIASAPAAMILAALCAGLAPGRWGKAFVGLAMVGAASWGIVARLPDDGRVIRARGEDWRSAVAWLNEQRAAMPDPVLVRSGLIESQGLRGPHPPLLEDYCLLPVTSLYVVQAERSDLVPLPSQQPWQIDDELAARLHDRGGVWLVIRIRRESDARLAAAQLVRRLDRHAVQANHAPDWRIVEENSRSFGGVHVLHLERQEQTDGRGQEAQ